MEFITSRNARSHWSDLLNEVERGLTITITRHGKEVARLVPCNSSSEKKFPDLSDFRSSIKVKGKSASDLISEMREEERF
jgi:prevent-host-death family protein